MMIFSGSLLHHLLALFNSSVFSSGPINEFVASTGAQDKNITPQVGRIKRHNSHTNDYLPY